MQVIKITGEQRRVIEPQWLQRAESVHRQLRPQIVADYAGYMQKVFAEGAEMCIAARGDDVLGVAVYRVYHNTSSGHYCYVDDLVTDESQRSTGVGRALLAFIEDEARQRGCDACGLDSGVQRGQAHKFYFREGMTVTSFNFKKSLA